MKRLLVASLAVLLSFPLLISCENEIQTGETTKKEMEQTEANHKKLVAAVPPPRLKDSLERRNLSRRLKRFNDSEKISYIYLVNYGKVMAFYTVKGKVSSVNSLLTSPDQVIVIDVHNGDHSHKIASPDLDGSYGSNGDAIFFFTTDDVYVEWKGDYMLADQPLQLTTPPQLVRELK